MESSQIVKARARAAELQAKIDATLQRDYCDDEGLHGSLHSQNLIAIRTALLHLQDQLDSLQALQKRQKFEKEDLLVELEERRNLLIKRLREYKGTEWEIVHEAHAFVGEPVQREDDLMLPPYQSSTRDAYASREECHSGSLSGQEESRTKDKQNQPQLVSTSNKTASCNGTHVPGFVFGLSKLASRVGKVVLLSAKSVAAVASIMFMLSQLEPSLRKCSSERATNTGFRIHGSAHRSNRPSSLSRSNGPVRKDEFCPPDEVLLVQDGIHKCIVKERTEASFKEVMKQPDATYGCG